MRRFIALAVAPHKSSGFGAEIAQSVREGLSETRRPQLVVITDALKSPTCHVEISAGVLAIEAGAEILLYTDCAPGELRAPNRSPARPHHARAGKDRLRRCPTG